MDLHWIEPLSIIATVIASAYYVHREVQSDIRAVREEIKSNREEQNLRLEAQSQRTDRLYEMFIDLLKENKK